MGIQGLGQAWRGWQTRCLVRALREETTVAPGWRFRSALWLGADPNVHDQMELCLSSTRRELGEAAVLARLRPLLAAGADPNRRRTGHPPFVMPVVFQGWLATFDLLVAHGADPLATYAGFSTVHQARHPSMVDRLIALGASLDTPSHNGTALRMAHTAVVHLDHAQRRDPQRTTIDDRANLTRARALLAHLHGVHRRALDDAFPDPLAGTVPPVGGGMRRRL